VDTSWLDIGGVRDGRQECQVHAGVQTADGSIWCAAAWTIALWVRQAKRDTGTDDGGLTTPEREELAQLRRENRKLKEEREILSKAAAWFATEEDDCAITERSVLVGRGGGSGCRGGCGRPGAAR
jgi:hypothetical protein